ncbi:MAG TPA: S8 family peptidase, partial [Burkholderiales bacterium]|nr:S8 family peptidase [Burkholderiales bacterium]
MRSKTAVLTLAFTTGFTVNVAAQEAPLKAPDDPPRDSSQERAAERGEDRHSVVAEASLIAAGIVGIFALGGGSHGDSGGKSGGTSASAPPRSLAYTSAADFQTPEYDAQAGLRWVNASSLYYNGYYRWYTGAAPDAAAGTGVGVKIAVADTGINPREGSTGSTIAIDGAASYDYVNNRPGAAADDAGHGSHVAGLIAAPRNGAGMQGLAYNATLVDFKVADSRGVIMASDAQLADMMRRAGDAGAMIINNSWNVPTPITSYTAQDLQGLVPQLIEASRSYVGKGGVVVFAAGNGAGAQPAMQPGLPYGVSGLEPGWLAVVAIDGSGKLASYSNRCGVAAAWCLAAPGGSPDSGLYSMYNNGGYASMYGTSMAAPHVAAAIAALKSMFVNLSYLQIRERLLYTANRGGAYADASTYGQGLIDLAAASSPVGGIAVPTGASASGATAPVAGSAIVFQAGTVQALRLQPWVLVVDNYQRAPFWLPADSFFHESAPRLVERQWASLRSGPLGARVERIAPRLSFSHSAGLNNALAADFGTYRLGFSHGAGGEAALGAQLGLVSLPRLAAAGTDSIALAYASNFRSLRLGLIGTLPGVAATEPRTLDASALGNRRALGAIVQRAGARTSYGLTLAVADQFERPIGIATSGAFGARESQALSTGVFVQHRLVASTLLDASFEVARHRTQADLALSAPAFATHTASLAARTDLGSKTTLSAGLQREWTGSEAALLQLPLTIGESGEIGRVAYRLPYDDLVGRTTLSVRLDHQFSKQIALRAGLTHERYGFGMAITGAAAI